MTISHYGYIPVHGAAEASMRLGIVDPAAATGKVRTIYEALMAKPGIDHRFSFSTAE